ncbi:MAG: hypothetical protein HWE22_12270 [Flavobacteriales bacterium]|nr:hypothetical protein [Flavobacteriales bacterium]
MTSTKTKALAIFVVTSIVLGIIFFVAPIQLFDSQIHYVEPHRDYIVDAPLSLANYIGLYTDEASMEFVESYWLTPKGWFMVIAFIFGLPALLAYRIYLKSKK